MAKLWGWFTNNPIAQIITAFVLALIGWEVVKRNIQETGSIKERERIAAAQAEEQRRVEAARREITEGNNEARHQADEAVSNLPQYRATDELRRNDPDAAAIVLGSGERRSS
jgi:flagellar biosynthesis/type III secretory pathway M-ring protein FliF/YscJ